MKTHKRLCSVVSRVMFVNPDRVQGDIDRYSLWKQRTPQGTDWEGPFAFFKRVLTISFKNRHGVINK